MSLNLVTPEHVLEAFHGLQQSWEDPHYLAINRTIVELDENFSPPPDSGFEPLVDGLKLGLERASCYAVTRDMSKQIQSAAQALPAGGVFCPSGLIPQPHGFIGLAEPIWCAAEDGTMINIDAVAWTLADVYVQESDSHLINTVIITSYTDYTKVPPVEGSATRETRAFVHRHCLFVSAVAGMDRTEEVQGLLPKFLVAFWSLIAQPITGVRLHQVARPFAKRAHRAGKPSKILVVEMRRKLYDDEPERNEEHDPVSTHQWKFRWKVDGFWRRQYYPSLGSSRLDDGSWNEESHRWIYVEDFEKGPEGMPLRSKERVFQVKR